MLASVAAVGYFQRLDAVTGSDDTATLAGAQASALSNDYTLYTSGPFSDPESSELISRSTADANVRIDDAIASSMVQELAEIITPIGSNVVAPTVSLVSQQLESADATRGAAQGASAQIDSAITGLKGSFQYVDTVANQGENLLVGVHLVGAGGGVAWGYSSTWTNPTSEHLQVWKGNTLIAQFDANGGGHGAFDDAENQADPGQTLWTLTATIGINTANPTTITTSSQQLNFFVLFKVDGLSNGDIITFTTQNATTGLINGFDAGIATATGNLTAAGPAHPVGDPHGSAHASQDFGESINAFCYGISASVSFGPPIVINAGRAPADLNGDRTINEDDSVLWAQDLGKVAHGDQSMLMVTTEEDTVNGDTSYFDLSLREALALAGDSNHPGSDTIVVAPWVHSITLSYDGADSGPTPDQLVANNVSILGPGADNLTISGGGQTRVLQATNSTIRGVTITGGNAGTQYLGVGGGISAQNVTVQDSRITGNTSTFYGGGIAAGGSFNLINSEVSGNTSGADGGGVSVVTYVSDYQIKVANSTISGNHSSTGGGLFIRLYGSYEGLDFTITNSTISGNTAYAGGGLYGILLYTYDFTVNITNTIIAGNAAQYPGSKDVMWVGTNPISSHNLIGYDPDGVFSSGTYNIRGTTSVLDPRLSALDFHGGTTKTYALLSDSLAIDAGDNDVLDDLDLMYDQRGISYDRKVDSGVADRIDIGAFELALGELYT